MNCVQETYIFWNLNNWLTDSRDKIIKVGCIRQPEKRPTSNTWLNGRRLLEKEKEKRKHKKTKIEGNRPWQPGLHEIRFYGSTSLIGYVGRNNCKMQRGCECERCESQWSTLEHHYDYDDYCSSIIACEFRDYSQLCLVCVIGDGSWKRISMLVCFSTPNTPILNIVIELQNVWNGTILRFAIHSIHTLCMKMKEN